MSPTKAAILAAIRGAFVADVASMGTHWIYDPAEMAKTVPSVEAPEFKDPPTPQFYSSEEFPGHYGPGMMSPYGEIMLFFAEYLAKNLQVDGEKLSEDMLEFTQTFGGRPDGALKTFAENMKEGKKYPECGADDHQAHCLWKAVLVACLYAGKPELAVKVKEAVLVHQNNAAAVAYGVGAAILFEATLLGSTLEEAIQKSRDFMAASEYPEKDAVLNAIDNAKKSSLGSGSFDDFLVEVSHEMMKDQPDSPYYNIVGRSCSLPASFTAPIFLFGKAIGQEKGDSVFMEMVRSNILGSGDTCGRAPLIGAVGAVVFGGPPQEWLDKIDSDTLAKIDAAANTIADHVVASCAAT